MKLKKKTALIASFTIGTLLFATTALADLASKSGYEQLKDGVKIAAEKMTNEYDSYTIEMTAVIKDNGRVIVSENTLEKIDRLQKAQISVSNNQRPNGKTFSSTVYQDSKVTIRDSHDENKIYLTEYETERDLTFNQNPFAEEEATDVERIVDALVGGLQEHVIVKENPDGTKELSGSLSEMQIPTLINAVSSFLIKQTFDHNDPNYPRLTKDIAITKVEGTALINSEGALESILGTVLITGKTAQGEVHELTLELLGEVSDINSTVVVKPDLSGKEVVTEQIRGNGGIQNPQKFVGNFKSDIIIEENGKLVKVGERKLQITSISNLEITGIYKEEIREGYERYASVSSEFIVSGTFYNDEYQDANIKITAGDGKTYEGHLYLDDYNYRVGFYPHDVISPVSNLDGNFHPVLD